MARKKLTSKSVNFYKIYAVNIIITAIFICLISFISSTFSSRMILRNMKAFHEEMLSEKSGILDERIRQLEETVYTIAGEENVFKLLMADPSYYEKSTVTLKVIRYFQNVCSNNNLIEGVSLIDAQRGYIINEQTKLPLAEYEFYAQYESPQSLVVSDTAYGKKLEYVKLFEPIRGQRKVYLIFTLDEEAFVSNLLIENDPEMVKTYLLTGDDQILSANGQDEAVPLIGSALLRQEEAIQEVDLNGQLFVLYKHRSQVSDVALASVQDYTYLLQDADRVKNTVIIVSLLMIAAASAVIYLCSLYVYRPLKQLTHRLQNIAPHDAIEPGANEYSLIEDVVTNLQREKEYARPSLVRDSVSKLMTEPFDEDRFEHLKRLLEQTMALEWYVLMIAECEEHADMVLGEFRRLVRENPEMDGIFSDLSSSRVVGILNTSLAYDHVLLQINTLKNSLETDHHIRFICCVSRSFKNPENMNLIYAETLRTLERTIFAGKNSFIYEKDPVVEYKNDYYNRELENRLTQYVTEGRREEALATLAALTKDLGNEARNIQYTRFIYFQICNHLVQNMLEIGGHLSRDWNEKSIFEAVFNVDSILDLNRMAEEIVNVCVEAYENQEQAYTGNVKKVISFIEENYMRDLSLEDVANVVFLSSGYLSTIFKEETGYTVLEYITYIRMQEARKLVLQTPALKIKEIAERLGYNNVQSFIRYFKKYYGETPMMYRKNRV